MCSALKKELRSTGINSNSGPDCLKWYYSHTSDRSKTPTHFPGVCSPIHLGWKLEDWKDEYFAVSLSNSMPCFGLFRHSFLINSPPQAPQKIASRTEEQQCAAGQGALGL